jgi:hypothetical protein
MEINKKKRKMVLFVDNGCLDFKPVSGVVISTIIAAFTFLSAMSIRDSVTQMIELCTPKHTLKKLIVTVSCTMLFLFITVLLAYEYQSSL